MQEIGKKDSQTIGQSLELPARMRVFLKPMLPIRGVPHSDSVSIGSALAPLLNTGVDPGNQQLGPTVLFPAGVFLSNAFPWLLQAQIHLILQQVKPETLHSFPKVTQLVSNIAGF